MMFNRMVCCAWKCRRDIFERIFGEMYYTLDRDTPRYWKSHRQREVGCNDPSILLASCCNATTTTFTISNCATLFPIPRASRSNPAVIHRWKSQLSSIINSPVSLWASWASLLPGLRVLRGCLFQFRRASARVRPRGAPKRTRLWGGDEGEIENRPAKREKRRPWATQSRAPWKRYQR